MQDAEKLTIAASASAICRAVLIRATNTKDVRGAPVGIAANNATILRLSDCQRAPIVHAALTHRLQGALQMAE